MNRKLALGWLLICLGFSSIGGGWLMLARGAQAAGSATPTNSAQVPGAIDEELVRIHVIANSDSEADQALKLQVRDAVLARLEPLLVAVASTAEAEAVIASALPDLEAEASRVVAEQGFTYPVRAELGRFAFPGKSYGSLYLPAGQYKALRLLIGKGEGANFWCLVYPSFCYTLREVERPPVRQELFNQELSSQGLPFCPRDCTGFCPW